MPPTDGEVALVCLIIPLPELSRETSPDLTKLGSPEILGEKRIKPGVLDSIVVGPDEEVLSDEHALIQIEVPNEGGDRVGRFDEEDTPRSRHHPIRARKDICNLPSRGHGREEG